jgi:hypothetical protein
MASANETGADAGLSVPNYPYEGTTITQSNASSSSEVLTIKRGASATGGWLSLQEGDGTARFGISKNAGVLWRARTTRPTTGLTKGEMMVIFHGSTPKIAICTSTAGQTLKLIRARTKTFGRLTA